MALADRINGAVRRIPTWPIYVAGLVWAGWLFWLGLSGAWVEPINTLEREYGDTALKLLVAGLCVTPLRTYAGVNLVRFRRALGLTAFFFVVVHFSVWALLDVQNIGRVWADILKRPYVTVGMTAFVLLIPLAATSNNLSLRKLGPVGWRKLHKLTYPVVILGAVHYLWLAKGFQIEPIVYLVAILALVGLRYVPRRRSVIPTARGSDSHGIP